MPVYFAASVAALAPSHVQRVLAGPVLATIAAYAPQGDNRRRDGSRYSLIA